MVKKQPEKKEEQLFYVEVQRPDDVQRLLLESLKDIVENLQRFESLKDTRTEKLNRVASLKKILREIQIGVKKLKGFIPETTLRAIPPPKKKRRSRKKHTRAGRIQKSSAPIVPKKASTEIERLDQELSAIESKLSQLQ